VAGCRVALDCYTGLGIGLRDGTTRTAGLAGLGTYECVWPGQAAPVYQAGAWERYALPRVGSDGWPGSRVFT
jgi:hypothetical protein